MELSPGLIIDMVLGVALIVALLVGISRGLIRIIGGMAGLAAGAIAAFFVLPWVSSWAGLLMWRIPLALGVAGILLSTGFMLGMMLGGIVRAPLARTPLRGIDRLLGGAANLVGTAAVILLVSFGAQSLAFPGITQTLASSQILRTIDEITPRPVATFLAQLRSTIVTDGVPRILDAVGIPQAPPEIPSTAPQTEGVVAAQASVVRITANTPACGTGSVGSGYVAAPDRIITNAHVVAGATELVVESPSALPRPGTVVHFDPGNDLAVIAVTSLAAAPVPHSSTTAPGAVAVFLGYPHGGPFSAQPAEVLSTELTTVADIYGTNPTPRPVTTIAAHVQQGNSGGPLLNSEGAVIGVIFAKSEGTANLGYAIAAETVAPLAARAGDLSTPVTPGACIPR